MSLSLDQLTMGEIDQLEKIMGTGISAVADESAPKARFLIAIAYLAKRREDPSFTLSDAEALTLAEVNEITGGASGE